MRTEDLVVAFFSYALEMVGEGRDCLTDSLSNDGIDDDDGSFVARAGDANGGHLRLLAGWRINCSLRWHDNELAAGRTMVLARWRDNELAARRMALLASWCDGESVAGQTFGR